MLVNSGGFMVTPCTHKSYLSAYPMRICRFISHIGMDYRYPGKVRHCHPWHWIPPIPGGMTFKLADPTALSLLGRNGLQHISSAALGL